ncbi:hypothetical protein EDC18_10225 [Natranaerovirga pectinivora]|uniref:Uncharacterized protein n=1 Tax=Natranaerovirga pectinivora TaxID=682400 RepID=A0A4R3MP18_9FIRM|nr:hypothetical protein [Natranaerovirga pectinivora]TCT16011.1 hypothetical protein EDC18_10225 [Natranaerovirga pectinivora]
MENKYFLNFETAWSFPIMQYVTNSSYVEVRKASGIAYILLELISESENIEEKLVVTLKNLGVPYDIHYIFCGELANMIDLGIVRMKANRDFGVDLLEMYYISDFEVTELGKRLFAEGTIPTGNNSIKKLNVYYDLATKNIMIKSDYRLFRFDSATIDEGCIGKVQLNSDDVELFISENMHSYGFRKGEAITGCEHENPEAFVYKLEDAVVIQIDQEKMYLSAKDKARNTYISENYSIEIISNIIGAKKKYHFPDDTLPEIPRYDYSDVYNVEQIAMPSQLFTVLAVKNQLSLSTGIEMKNSECIIDKNEVLEIFQQSGIEGYACYFENGTLYKIIPGRFEVELEGFQSKCEINLIITQRMSDECANQVLRGVFLKCIETEEPIKRCNVIKKLTEISTYKDYAEQFTFSLLKKQKNIEDKVGIFLKLNNKFLREKWWHEFVICKAQELFDDLCAQVTIDNFSAKNTLGESLNKILKQNDFDYLSSISRNLIVTEGEEIAYEAMEGLNYSAESVLGVINIFKTYCVDVLNGETISSQSKLGRQCVLLGQSLSELKELTGISDVIEDAAELDIDADRFIQVLATYNDMLKKLEKYRLYAVEQFNALLAFNERYTDIREIVTIEIEALKNPSNINKNYINQRLKKSRYKDAICDLHIRLQYELNRLFGTQNAQTYDLLSNAGITRYLSEDELSEMHVVRKCRNEFQHPTGKRNNKYSEQRIKEWCQIVEKLGGMDNESCSKN